MLNYLNSLQRKGLKTEFRLHNSCFERTLKKQIFITLTKGMNIFRKLDFFLSFSFHLF